MSQQIVINEGCTILLSDSPLYYHNLNGAIVSPLLRPANEIPLPDSDNEFYKNLILPYADGTLNHYYHFLSDSLPKLIYFLHFVCVFFSYFVASISFPLIFRDKQKSKKNKIKKLEMKGTRNRQKQERT